MDPPNCSHPLRAVSRPRWLWSGLLVLMARSADGLQAGFVDLTNAEDEVELTLAPAATVLGRALDEDRKPIAKATATLMLSFPYDFFENTYTNASLSAITDAEGRYRIAGVPVGVTPTLSVQTRAGVYLSEQTFPKQTIDDDGNFPFRDSVTYTPQR